MRIAPTLCSLGLLVSLGLPLAASAADAPPEEEAPRRPPQFAVELGGFITRMEHPTALVPTTRALVRTVEPRNTAVRLSGGLHFNILRGSNRNDLWWINGVDWYFADDVQVLAFRPGLEKRFPLTRELTLGVAAFGSGAEVSLPTGRISQNQPDDPNNGPMLGDNYYEARTQRWIFGAGGLASFHYSFGRWVYMRVQGGYTQYFKKAEGFEGNSTLNQFSVSLSGPFAGAMLGLSL
ncbi:hypothetical protein [Pyxidicoccus trucidator]|uniref:hypothetical protein n=1 Tax=Pyxidicoccus trucidator TaxID=2709662 RepID=UPI0013D94373|nr:hypothetical protein [Pyxidicoccus trucidator]